MVKQTLITLLLILPSSQLLGRDFLDSPGAAFPGQITKEEGFFPGLGAFFSHQNALFINDDVDSFSFRLEHHGVFYRWGEWSIGYQFDSILFGGPLAPGDQATAAVGFWLNAVQFEYGLALGWSFEHLELSLQYDRQSLHPLRNPYDQTAYDVLKAGFLARWQWQDWSLRFASQYGFYLLWPLWESLLPVYRYRHSLDNELEVSWELGAIMPTLQIRVQGILTPEDASGNRALLWDNTWLMGLQIQGLEGMIFPYFFYTHVSDSELIDTGPHTQDLMGLGIRMGTF